MKTLQQLKSEMLANPETRKAYDALNLDTERGRLIAAPAARRSYTLEQVLAMEGDAPLALDTDWDTMPAMGREVAL